MEKRAEEGSRPRPREATRQRLDDYDGHEESKDYYTAIPRGTGTGIIGRPSILLKSEMRGRIEDAQAVAQWNTGITVDTARRKIRLE